MKVIFIFSILIQAVLCTDYYTSLLQIRKLLKIEPEIINLLESYKIGLENKIEIINRYLDDYKESILEKINPENNQKFEKQIPKYDQEAEEFDQEIYHPLKVYRLIRRLTKNIQEIEKELNGHFETKWTSDLEKIRSKIKFPQKSDMTGINGALLRIQDTYDLDIVEFCRGEFDGLKTNSGLRAIDVFLIGEHALEFKIFTRAIEWLKRAYKMTTEENDKTIDSDRVQKKLIEAIDSHNLAVVKSENREKPNIYLSKTPISTNISQIFCKERIPISKPSRKYTLYSDGNYKADLINFIALCKGKPIQKPKSTKDLKCWLKKDHPTLFIGPVKTEMHHKNPPVLQFYDIIPDHQILEIMKIAQPLLNRAQVVGDAGLGYTRASYQRTASTAWIAEEENEVLKGLPKKLETISGLKLTPVGNASEIMQVCSNGIGGHTFYHFDYFNHGKEKNAMPKELELKIGDRIATIMVYLSDVERGGFTVFPRLGVAIKPIKRSAIFWLNMKRNGEPEPWSLHGGCPIIYGQKDVFNKWIRFNSQIFTRTCSLNPHE